MLYRRGDQVHVEGFGGRRAMLRVWEVRGRGLVLCTEDEYHEALAVGSLRAALGFPLSDIKPENRQE